MAADLTCLLYRSGQAPAEIEFAAIGGHVREAGSFVWIDIAEPHQTLLERLGRELGLHELALEDALTTHQRPKLEEYGGHLFISARTAQLMDSHIFFGEVHFFAGPNFVAAVRHGPELSFARVRERLASTRNGAHAGSPYALYLALDLIVDHYRPVLESLHQRFLELEGCCSRMRSTAPTWKNSTT